MSAAGCGTGDPARGTACAGCGQLFGPWRLVEEQGTGHEHRAACPAPSHASGGVVSGGDALTRIAASDGKQTNCKHLYSYINSGEPSRASRPATPRSRSKPRTASRPAGPRRMRVCEQRVPDAGSAQRVCGLRDPERARRGTLRARRVSEAVAARRVAAPIVCTGAAKGGGDMARGAAGRDRSSRP